jgi:hypothetical protein
VFETSLFPPIIWHERFDLSGIGISHDHSATCFPLHLLRTAAEEMLFISWIAPDLAGSGGAKTLFGARLSLQFWHFFFLFLRPDLIQSGFLFKAARYAWKSDLHQTAQ